MKSYQERIRELREDNDMTQTDVAKKLGIRYNVYQRYELGTAKMPIHHLIELAKMYNTTTDYILGLTDNRTPYPKKGLQASRKENNTSASKTSTL